MPSCLSQSFARRCFANPLTIADYSLHPFLGSPDFLGHDELVLEPESFTIPEFFGWRFTTSSGFTFGPNNGAGLTVPMNFNCRDEDAPSEERACKFVDFSIDGNGGELPAPWQMMSNDSPYLKVKHANDFLARQLVAANMDNADWVNPDWFEVAEDDVPVRCNRDPEAIVDTPITTPTPELELGPCPDIPFTNPSLALRWRELCQEQESIASIEPDDNLVPTLLSQLVKEDCESRGNPLLVSEQWLDRTGLSPELFECYQPLP